jgi:hypothetical protein
MLDQKEIATAVVFAIGWGFVLVVWLLVLRLRDRGRPRGKSN